MTIEPRNQALAPGTLTSRDAASPPVSDSARPTVSPCGPECPCHRILDRVVVDAEDDITGGVVQDRADGRLVPVEQCCRRPGLVGAAP